MTGIIEVLGLIFGVIPILFKTIQQCQKTYKVLDEWVHFQGEFLKVSNAVSLQRLFLKQLMTWTLASVTESRETSTRMLENPSCAEWKDPAFAEKLRQMLSGDEEYEAYYGLLQSVHDELEKVIHGLQKYSRSEPDMPYTPALLVRFRLRKEFRKLQFFFQKEAITERVEFATTQILSLERFFGNAERLRTSRQHIGGSCIAHIFERIRRQATSLHRAITRSWTCDCRDSHVFKLIIGGPFRPDHSGEDNQTLEEKPLRIALPCGDGARGDTLMPQSASNAVRWCIIEAALATTFEPHISVWSQLRSAENPSTQMLLTVPTGQQSGRATINGNSSTMLCQPQPTIVLSSAESAPHHEPPTLAPESTHVIHDLCSMLQFPRTTRQLGYLFDGTNSYHALVVVPTGTSSPEIVGQAVSLGHILAGSPSEVTGLTTAVAVATRLPSKAARLKIALTVAHSLLELFPSPWLPGEWDKNDIYFSVSPDGSVNTDVPFLISRNGSARTSNAQNQEGREPTVERTAYTLRPPDHTKILLSLGILILELWFGQSLESQPSWEANFGPNGKEKEFTKFNAAATWQRMVGDDGGPRLHNITHRCVHGNFGLDAQSLQDSELISAVYEKVVMELQHVYDGFFSLEGS
ncbi:hypothetical protein GE21DRAFT_6576 [Neurospora crassa]|uniref:DUF7580 domain-containing protein n=1 Tax=Neurospora crassa (strain ATCC 24698 / 74-OR23-1A / CBS 708.71 / DSM 1257 / FGSC 987) TaxID=367110 RepID=Q7S8F8_NEUCR|nr:hypothetical protein NCU08812 [Neurospora crassa OR74A]EAA32616.2 hypothetical protein NCU08812 [Neurospora crassa OR74A]KHE78793.1 hypothetical protein GE21DRAFT_6576 [Neurospora crassa]|eukprot:XP_961852.2 hypothetical protein NCU08812 [Neurospora crassa OR74A]